MVATMDKDDFTTMDIETSGLSCSKDFITCIGIMDSQGIHQFTSPASMFRSSPLEAEGALMSRFFSYIKCNPIKALLTYNGNAFDIPFINKRYDTEPFSPEKHIDLMEYSSLVNGRMVKKDDNARHMCNLHVPWSTSAAYLAKAYDSKSISDEDHHNMLSHNAIDLVITRQMFGRLERLHQFKTFLFKNGIEVVE